MLNLQDREWSAFFIEDLCEIYSGVRLTKADMIKGGTPFIGASDSNNGITEFVANKNSSYKAGVLGVNYNGSVVENFYHPYAALFSDDVKQLRIKNCNQSKYVYLFLKTAILQQKSKYAYGYKFNAERMRRQLLMLPVDTAGQPDWCFMEEYMREREQLLIKRYRSYIQREIDALENSMGGGGSIAELDWKEFRIVDIFSLVKRGKRLRKSDHIKGKVPYAASTSTGNGIDGYCGNSNGVRTFADCISLANSGSVGSCFYHPYEYVASDHVTAIKRDGLDKYAYLFVAALFKRLGKKYSFNREISDKRLRREVLILPIDESQAPAWEAMSNYVKEKERAALYEYLSFLETNG